MPGVSAAADFTTNQPTNRPFRYPEFHRSPEISVVPVKELFRRVTNLRVYGGGWLGGGAAAGSGSDGTGCCVEWK
ncbi:hypothetical protein M0804_007520 [Polistes exclamans]|nr:hypothetical protein M0804_007520 [Polistes exclamans]